MVTVAQETAEAKLLDGKVIREQYFVQEYHPDEDYPNKGDWWDIESEPHLKWEQADKVANTLLGIFETKRFRVVRRTVVEKELRTYQTTRSQY